jgi:hypothetical protein
MFSQIRQHYRSVADSFRLPGTGCKLQASPVQALVLVDDVHTQTIELVNFAKSLGHPWRALHVAINPEKAERTRARWEACIKEGELIVVPSPYRRLVPPIQEYVRGLQTEYPGCFVHIIMGQIVMDTVWEQALHQNSAVIFNLAFSRVENVAVTTVPYQIHQQARHGSVPKR